MAEETKPTPLIRIESMDGTIETTQIFYNGNALNQDIKLIRLFTRLGRTAKDSTIAGLFQHTSKASDGSSYPHQFAEELIGKNVKPSAISYLFGSVMAPPEEPPVDPPTEPNPQDPVPEDDYTYPDVAKDITLAPFTFEDVEKSLSFEDSFQTFDTSVWTLSSMVVHSESSEMLQANGSGTATATLPTPIAANEDFRLRMLFPEAIWDGMLVLDSARLNLKFERGLTDNQMVVKYTTQSGFVIDSDTLETGPNSTLVIRKIGTQLVIESTPYSGKVFVKDFFHPLNPLTTLEWKFENASTVIRTLDNVQIHLMKLQSELTPQTPVAPETPTNVRAVIEGDHIVVYWDTQPDITFTVYMSTDNIDFTELQPTVTGGGAFGYFSVTEGTQYWFRVVASTDTETSAPSETVTIVYTSGGTI